MFVAMHRLDLILLIDFNAEVANPTWEYSWLPITEPSSREIETSSS